MKFHFSNIKYLTWSFIVGIALFGCAQHKNSAATYAEKNIVEFDVGAQRIQAEVVFTPEGRAQGLMYRTQLCPDCGMIFLFPQKGGHCFWSKHTPLPLALAFVTIDGKITKLANMIAESEAIVCGNEDTVMVLEMNKDWFAAHGFKQGERFLKKGAIQHMLERYAIE